MTLRDVRLPRGWGGDAGIEGVGADGGDGLARVVGLGLVGQGDEAGVDETAGGLAGGVRDLRGGDLPGLGLVGGQEFEDEGFEVVADVGGVEGAAGVLGDFAGGEGVAAGGQEVGPADLEDGTEGEGEGEGVDVAGAREVQEGHGERTKEAPEGVAGESQGGQLLQEVVLRVEAHVGADRDAGKRGIFLASHGSVA